MYQSEHRRNLNRLEALLSRHWPELGRLAELNSASILHLLATDTTPQAVCDQREQAAVFLHRMRRGVPNPMVVTAILERVATTLGVPCTAGEQHLLHVLATELLRTRQALRGVERRMIEHVNQDPLLQRVGQTFGKATALVLEATLGSPLDDADPHADLKAMGLNLKERRSGQHQGRC